MKSLLKKGGVVSFPAFAKERAYMVPFVKGKNLPDKYSRWQSTVDAMLEAVDVAGVVYLTIDRGKVRQGETQRRKGAHIDGLYTVKGWSTGPQWNIKHGAGGGIVLASDHIGCKAFLGELAGDIGEGGDCSSMDLSSAKTCLLMPHQIYIGNSSLVHKSIPAAKTQNRTFVRLTLPESFAFAA